VGEVKKKYGAPVFRPERELQVIRKVQGANPGRCSTKAWHRSGAR
jgi:chorismate mutase/prephenate dehydratase